MTFLKPQSVVELARSGNFAYPSYFKNPCYRPGSKTPDEAQWVVFFRAKQNPLGSVWGYCETLNDALGIIGTFEEAR